MSIYRMTRPANLLTTMKFTSYNAAITFTLQSGLLSPTKPYKRFVWDKEGEQVVMWCVTLGSVPVKVPAPQFEKVAA